MLNSSHMTKYTMTGIVLRVLPSEGGKYPCTFNRREGVQEYCTAQARVYSPDRRSWGVHPQPAVQYSCTPHPKVKSSGVLPALWGEVLWFYLIPTGPGFGAYVGISIFQFLRAIFASFLTRTIVESSFARF